MKSTLDIKNLIEKAETICYDGRIEMAAEGETPVQIMETENGRKYQLSIKMKMINDEKETN